MHLSSCESSNRISANQSKYSLSVMLPNVHTAQHIPVPWLHPDPWPALWCNFRTVCYFPWCYILFLNFSLTTGSRLSFVESPEHSSIRTISRLQLCPSHIFSFPLHFLSLSLIAYFVRHRPWQTTPLFCHDNMLASWTAIVLLWHTLQPSHFNCRNANGRLYPTGVIVWDSYFLHQLKIHCKLKNCFELL